ncbi:MAG: hypothetical protein ABR889_05550 [Acidobacteriaceae bacterium]|jgi:hypothetical protein
MTVPTKLFGSLSDRYPEPDEDDVAIDAGKTVVSLVPVLGPLTVATLGNIFTPPLEQRRKDWFKEVADGLDDLRAKVEGFSPEKLADHPAFVSAFVQASRIAEGTHQTEKRDLLRNALLNIAIGHAPSEDMQHIYLRWIGELTPTHIRLLNLLWSPFQLLAGKIDQLQMQRGIPLLDGVQLLYPELNKDRHLLEACLLDLSNAGLSNNRTIDQVLGAPGVTNVGIDFLNFVGKSPIG